MYKDDRKSHVPNSESAESLDQILVDAKCFKIENSIA